METPPLQCLEPKTKTGLVVVMTGDGKGKTTSALGICVRAAGYGMKVCFIQFMKGDMYSGEIDGIKRLAPNVELNRTGKGFCGIMGNPYPYEEHRANAQEAVKLAREKTLSGNYDIIILDEINNACHLRLVDLAQVLELLDLKPPLVHMALTGRNAPQEVIDRADTVSEIRDIKHAYRRGIEPQKGIDY